MITCEFRVLSYKTCFQHVKKKTHTRFGSMQGKKDPLNTNANQMQNT